MVSALPRDETEIRGLVKTRTDPAPEPRAALPPVPPGGALGGVRTAAGGGAVSARPAHSLFQSLISDIIGKF